MVNHDYLKHQRHCYWDHPFWLPDIGCPMECPCSTVRPEDFYSGRSLSEAHTKPGLSLAPQETRVCCWLYIISNNINMEIIINHWIIILFPIILLSTISYPNVFQHLSATSYHLKGSKSIQFASWKKPWLRREILSVTMAVQGLTPKSKRTDGAVHRSLSYAVQRLGESRVGCLKCVDGWMDRPIDR